MEDKMGKKRKGIRAAKPFPPPPKPKASRVATSDGSAKGPDISAHAHLVVDGKVVGEARLHLRREGGGLDSSLAEGAGFLLSALLSYAWSYPEWKKGERVEVVLQTDSESTLQTFLTGKGLPPVRAVRTVLQGMEVRAVKVPRNRVASSHNGAKTAREEGAEAARKATRVAEALKDIPPNYRKSALEALRRYALEGGNVKGLTPHLEAWGTPTAEHLLKALEGKDPLQVASLLKTLKEADGAFFGALVEGGYLEALEAKPPTERQLRYLEALGYTGPPPRTALEASRLIEERRWKGRD